MAAGSGIQERLCWMENLKSLTKTVAPFYVTWLLMTMSIATVILRLIVYQTDSESNGKTPSQFLGVFEHHTWVLSGTSKTVLYLFLNKRSKNTLQPSKNGNYVPNIPSLKYKNYMESYYTPPWWCQKDEHTLPTWRPCWPPLTVLSYLTPHPETLN